MLQSNPRRRIAMSKTRKNEATQWPNQTTAELSKGKTPVSEMRLRKNPELEAKLSLQNNPDSKPWINQRLPDHDKSQREKGRH
jgi:hypothetical protein